MLLCFLAAVILIGAAVSFRLGKDVQVKSTVTRDAKYKSAVTAVTPETFEKKGFHLGDSCDVFFENGYSLTDVPYYDGFYVNEGDPVIVDNASTPTLLITLDNTGIWDAASLREGDTVTIRLHEKGKYASVQDVLSLRYSLDRADYESDAVFCNFRAMSGGDLKKDFFYRGASPVNDRYQRAALTDALIAEAGICFEMDLSETDEETAALLAENGRESSYAMSLYENNRAVMLGLGLDYHSAEYRQSVAEGFRQMMRSDGPVYIHCVEGKDRTGFVCILLEALAGASYDEMLEDFMETYRNYYSVDRASTPERYRSIVELYFEDFIRCLLLSDNGSAEESVSYSEGSARYLLSGGMTEEEVRQLKMFLTE